MSDVPNYNFDIDFLFRNLPSNLPGEPQEILMWVFHLRSPDIEVLEQVADSLAEEFSVEIFEGDIEIDEEGNDVETDPLLMATVIQALTKEEVKSLAERFQEIAERHSLVYDGVDCLEPDEETDFGWLSVAEAENRLANFARGGFDTGRPVPWCFLVEFPSSASFSAITEAYSELGYDDRNDYDEADEDGLCYTCIFHQGPVAHGELTAAASKISEIAAAHEGELAGVQFYSREMFDEMLSDVDDDDED